MIRTQIQLEEEDFEELRREAARSGCSISAYVRRSVQTALASGRREGAYRQAAELAGKYRSGLNDLAVNHDEYLSDGW